MSVFSKSDIFIYFWPYLFANISEVLKNLLKITEIHSKLFLREKYFICKDCQDFYPSDSSI